MVLFFITPIISTMAAMCTREEYIYSASVGGGSRYDHSHAENAEMVMQAVVMIGTIKGADPFQDKPSLARGW